MKFVELPLAIPAAHAPPATAHNRRIERIAKAAKRRPPSALSAIVSAPMQEATVEHDQIPRSNVGYFDAFLLQKTEIRVV